MIELEEKFSKSISGISYESSKNFDFGKNDPLIKDLLQTMTNTILKDDQITIFTFLMLKILKISINLEKHNKRSNDMAELLEKISTIIYKQRGH